MEEKSRVRKEKKEGWYERDRAHGDGGGQKQRACEG